MDDFCCGYATDAYCDTCGQEIAGYEEDRAQAAEARRITMRLRYEHDEDFRNQMKAGAAAWARANPKKASAKYKRRDALRRGATISDFTLRQWEVILEEHDHRCFYCGVKGEDTPQGWLTQEHLIPLSRGGDHTASNIKPACQSCNSKKGQLTAEEFLLRV